MEGTENRREDIHSLAIRAGRRTYFFDVKETRKGDYYLTITESKKVWDNDGNSRFEKHKVFLYKEDFIKFSEAFDESINFLKQNKPDYFVEREESDYSDYDSKDKKEDEDSE
jgi:hypothetical protein